MKRNLSNYIIHNKFKMRILPKCVYRTVKYEYNELNFNFIQRTKI